MTIGSGIAYAAFWFGLFGTICWVLWLAYLEACARRHLTPRERRRQEQRMSLVADVLLWVSLRIWKTDLTFHQYPFGPPDSGIKYGFAMWAYSTSLEITRREAFKDRP